MTTATLELGTRSVEIPVVDESGAALVSSDLGKPEINVRSSGGSLFPRTIDQFSGLQNITLVGRFTSADAYRKARDVVELIEADLDGRELTVTFDDLGEYDDNLLVAPSAGSDQAVRVTHPPGRRNNVQLDLSLTRISGVQSVGNRTVSTPTATGTGPIELRAGGETVTITADVEVQRQAGRPNDVVRRRPDRDLPVYYNKPKAITETISLAFELTENTVSDLQTIGQTIFRQQLGRDAVTLDFNGLYGFGEFDVVPVGAAPFRQVRRAGYEGQSVVPTFDFRRVRVD